MKRMAARDFEAIMKVRMVLMATLVMPMLTLSVVHHPGFRGTRL